MHRWVGRRWLLLVAVAAVVAVGSCGDDDASTSAAGGSAATELDRPASSASTTAATSASSVTSTSAPAAPTCAGDVPEAAEGPCAELAGELGVPREQITVVRTAPHQDDTDCPPESDELCDPGPLPDEPVTEIELEAGGERFVYRSTGDEWARVPG